MDKIFISLEGIKIECGQISNIEYYKKLKNIVEGELKEVFPKIKVCSIDNCLFEN